MKAQGIARLGRDAELHTTSSGETVASLALAFSYGKKGDDGRRRTQWVDADLWGKRAVGLVPYLTKGSQVVAYLDEVRIEEYESKKGPAYKLAAKVMDIELVSGGTSSEDSASAVRQAALAQAPRQAPAPARSGFDDLDNDVPF